MNKAIKNTAGDTATTTGTENTGTFKPKVKLTGQDGNIFNLVGIASEVLRKAGLNEQAKELKSKLFEQKSYDDALYLISNYCEIC